MGCPSKCLPYEKTPTILKWQFIQISHSVVVWWGKWGNCQRLFYSRYRDSLLRSGRHSQHNTTYEVDRKQVVREEQRENWQVEWPWTLCLLCCVFCLFTDASMASRPFTESLQLSYGLAIGFCSVKSFHNPMLLWLYTALLCAPFIPSTLLEDVNTFDAISKIFRDKLQKSSLATVLFDCICSWQVWVGITIPPLELDGLCLVTIDMVLRNDWGSIIVVWTSVLN